MHPVTARYMAQAYFDDREREAVRDRLARSCRRTKPTIPHAGRAASWTRSLVALFRRPAAVPR